jgi:hypothetical protein
MDGMWGLRSFFRLRRRAREPRIRVVEESEQERERERERERGAGEGARKDDEVLTDLHGREVCKHKYYFDRFFFLVVFWRIYLASFGEESIRGGRN